MLRFATLTTATAVLLASPALAINCDDRMSELDSKHDNLREAAGNSQVIYDLRSAAKRLQAQGNEEACASVVDALDKVIASNAQQSGSKSGEQSAQKAMDRSGSTKTDAADTAGSQTGDQTSETASGSDEMDSEDRTAERSGSQMDGQTSETASQGSDAMDGENRTAEQTGSEMNEQTVQADNDRGDANDIENRVIKLSEREGVTDTQSLIGTNVYNFENEFLGEVDGFVMPTNGGPSHIIVGHGGFWNIGDEEAAIPVDQMRWDPEWEVFYVRMTEEQLDEAPDYDLENGEWTAQQNDQYYANMSN